MERIPHPLVDWSKERVDRNGVRVIDLVCTVCGETRTRTAAPVANAIRNGAHGDVYYEKWQQAEMELARLKALTTAPHS